MKTRLPLLLVSLALSCLTPNSGGPNGLGSNFSAYEHQEPMDFPTALPGSTAINLVPNTAAGQNQGTGLAMCYGPGICEQGNGDGGVIWTGAPYINGLGYIPSLTPEGLFGTGGVSHASNALIGGYCLPGSNSVGTNRAFQLSALSGAVTVASGGGAANTVITVTDSNGTCTFTIPCNSAPPAGSNATGGIRIATNAGAGCTIAPGTCATVQVTTAGCTTTQPTIFDTFEGVWQ